MALSCFFLITITANILIVSMLPMPIISPATASRSSVPSNLITGLPLRTSSTYTGCLADVACSASLFSPDWSAHAGNLSLASLVMPVVASK